MTLHGGWEAGWLSGWLDWLMQRDGWRWFIILVRCQGLCFQGRASRAPCTCREGGLVATFVQLACLWSYTTGGWMRAVGGCVDRVLSCRPVGGVSRFANHCLDTRAWLRPLPGRQLLPEGRRRCNQPPASQLLSNLCACTAGTTASCRTAGWLWLSTGWLPPSRRCTTTTSAL